MSIRLFVCAAVGLSVTTSLLANSPTPIHREAPVQASGTVSGILKVVITLENDDVILHWNAVDSPDGSPLNYKIYRSSTPEFSVDNACLVATINNTCYRDPDVLSHLNSCFYRIEIEETQPPAALFFPPYPGDIIEDFESGSVVLYSYQNEDHEPNAWEVTSNFAYGGSFFSLALYGNTWKELRLDTRPYLTSESVWQIAMRSNRIAERQAFGIGDSTRVLFYMMQGTEFVSFPSWISTYQQTLSDTMWTPYLLPVGNDWEEYFGDLPSITRVIFVNDHDGIFNDGNTYFDEILDVTGNLPQAPQVHIEAIQYPTPLSSGPTISDLEPLVSVGFLGRVFDADGDSLSIRWDFGDGQTSSELRPFHVFPRFPNITVSLTATDPMGFIGTDVVTIPVSPPNVSGNIRMAFVGDVMMARRYDETGGIIPTYGANYIFRLVRDLLESSNIAVCNLECPFTTHGTPHPTKEVVFRGRPEYLPALNYAGFDMVTLANNHVWDYMDDGMIETMDVLDSLGMLRTGAGINNLLARQPAYITRNGVRVALLGFCNRTGRADGELPYLEAGMSKGGLAMLDYENLDDMIPYARETADRVVVFLHSGEEYYTEPNLDDLEAGESLELSRDGEPLILRTEPTDQEEELRRYALDLGADMVINSHPHVLQGYEVYEGKLIAHSLGNFAFDQIYWETFPSMLLESEFDAQSSITNYTFHPIYIDNYVPKPATGNLGVSIMERIMDYSRDLNTLIVPSNFDSTVGTIVVDSTNLHQEQHQYTVRIALLAQSPTLYISEPLPLIDGGASPSVIQSVLYQGTPVNCQIALGKEVLWIGGFEINEGSTEWNLNSSSEWYETSNTHSGVYCLGLSRPSSTPFNVITELERRMPIVQSHDHTLMGWIRPVNASQAAILIQWWRYRTGDNFLGNDTLQTPISGTGDWTFQYEHMDPPNNAGFINIRCNLFPPSSGTGYAYFDDLKLVEWESWISQIPYAFPYPNNLRYLRVKSDHFLDSVDVQYSTMRQWLE